MGDAQVVPREWVMDTRNGDAAAREAFARSESEAEYPGGMYRNQWWVLEPGAVYTGMGIHGQFAYVNVPADVVCVKLSTWPTPARRAPGGVLPHGVRSDRRAPRCVSARRAG